MINVSNEKTKVNIMLGYSDEITSEISTMKKTLNNLASNISGNTLSSYMTEMGNELSWLSDIAAIMNGGIHNLNKVIDKVYTEEQNQLMAARKRLLEEQKKQEEGKIHGISKA